MRALTVQPGRADPEWLLGLITRRVPLERFADALTAAAEDSTVVVELTGSDG